MKVEVLGTVPLHSKSLMLVGPREVQWCEEELPPLEGHEVLVRTIACAISTGSELPV